MSNIGPKSRAVIESGLLSEGDVLRQFQRWQTLPPDALEFTESHITMQGMVDAFIAALESDDALEMRDTDLDALATFMASSKRGRLYVPDSSARSGYRHTDINYSVSTMGEYLLPYKSEEIREELLGPDAYIKPTGEEPVYIADVRDLYYGSVKVFIVCTPAVEVEI